MAGSKKAAGILLYKALLKHIMAKIIFITGVSSGFGRDMANEAAKAGHTVIGTVRKVEQLKDVDVIRTGQTFGYLLDVNDSTLR